MHFILWLIINICCCCLVAKSRLTLCDSVDWSSTGSYVHKISQARILCYSCVLSHFSHVWLFATLWTITSQAPLSMWFSWQEYWSGLPCPFPGDLSDPGIELTSLTSPALAGGFFTINATWEAQLCYNADYILLFTYIWFKFLLFLLD